MSRCAEARIGITAVILGVGPIGLNCLTALKAAGARSILCMDRQDHRLALAESWGAAAVAKNPQELQKLNKQFHPDGADVVIDATGSMEMLEFAVSLVRFRGALVLAGFGGGRSIEFRPDTVQCRNVRILGAGNNSGYTESATLAANDSVVRTDEMITHRYSLAEAEEAFSIESFSRPGYIKGVFVFPD